MRRTTSINSSGLLSKVTEPGGRSVSITYRTFSAKAATSSDSVFPSQVGWSDLAIPASNPAAGQWIELPLSSSRAFNYVRILTADGASANIAEMQFYAAATGTTPERLIASDTATLISSGSLAAARSAADGQPDTVFESPNPSGAWIGWAFKSAIKLSRVRVLVKAGTEASVRPTGFGMQQLKIQGGLAQASSAQAITVISSVTTSSGRRVDYEYENFKDQLNQYPVLTGALYGDTTRSTYKYTQVADGTRPLVEEFDDVRYGLGMPHSKTVYQKLLTGGALGMVSKQINVQTGKPLLTLGIANGNLHAPTVTYSNGGVETQYMGEGNMTSQSDANKNTTSYTYDANGFLASTTDALGNRTTYTRTALGNLLTQTKPDGGVETWTRNALEAVTSYTDALGRVTTWTRDTHNRVTRTDYPDGSSEEFAYNGFAQPVQHRARNGQTESSVYDARGLLLSKTDPLGNTLTPSFDAFDRLNAITDPLGRTTRMEYSERGLVTRVLLPDGSFTAKTYNALGDVLSETNELGATWTYGSDLFRRVVTTTDPLGRTTTITYPADSPDITPLAVSSPSGRTVAYDYDLAWNKIAETLAPNKSEAAKTKFTYDKANRVVSVQDPLGKITKATYDKRGRVLTQADPLARVTAFQYDLAGNVVTKTRPDKAVEKTGYDALHRVLTSTDAAGKTTVYTYDLGGTLHGLTDAKGNAYVYTYDALNRKTRMTYPDGSHEDWEYDAVGNKRTYTTRGGQQLGSVFDARNRVTSSVWSDGTPSMTRTYDAAGRLLSAQSSVSALTYTYDAANQLLSETQLVAAEGVAHTVAYSYDVDGNRSRMVAPAGMALDYASTARNQVAAVSADGPPPIATYTYDLNGNRTQRSLENGTVTNLTYDDARQLLSVDHRTAAGSLVRLGYAYDKLGNRTSQKWEDGRVDQYGYDPLSQLIQGQYAPLGATPTRKATLARTTKYAYDPVGVLLRSDFFHRRWVPCESHKNRAPFLKQLHARPLSVTLHEFFGVSVRTLRRWKADGVDLECAESLRQYVRTQLRPAESVERRVYSPTFKEDLERILHPDRQEMDCNAFHKDLAGDPDFEPPVDLAELPDGPCYEPSDFSARVLQELRTAFTGIGIMVRLLEGDTELKARYGDARAAFAGDGLPVDDRDLMTLLLLVENLLSAQLHRVQGSFEKLIASSDCQEGFQCPEVPKVGTK